MFRDADLYHDPESFIPERYLPGYGKTVERDPTTILFGFGRRCVRPVICRHAIETDTIALKGVVLEDISL